MKSPLHEYQSPFVELMVLCWWINPFQTVFVTMKVWMEKANLQLCSRNQWARWAVMDATGWDNGGTGRCLGQAVSYNSKCYDHGEWQKERNKWLHLGQSFAFKVSLAPPHPPLWIPWPVISRPRCYLHKIWTALEITTRPMSTKWMFFREGLFGIQGLQANDESAPLMTWNWCILQEMQYGLLGPISWIC